MKYLLLLTFIGTMWVSSTQGQRIEFVLRFSRQFPSLLPNRILMECRHSSNGTLVDEPRFFRNGLPFSHPNIQDIPGLGVRFDVDRTTEGNFTCGVEGRTSTPPMTIVTRPDPANDMPEMETFFADVGTTARLDCSITPGALTFLYHVIWRNASNHDMIFYQIFSPRNIGQQQPSGLDQRYSLDFQNFSLFISDVGLDDAASDYQCVLGVVDPRDNTEFPFTSTEDINLSLSLFTAPEFVIEPTSQVVVAGANVTFLCTVFSSPLASSIGWRLRGTILDRHDVRIAIVSDVESVNSGMRTSSSLTISNVTGFDSDVVECFSEYLVNAAVMVSTVRSEATLSVLDVVHLNPPIPFRSRGFVFPIVPSHPLLIPVMVRLLYTDADNPSSRTTVQSMTTFFNTTVINMIAFGETVPPYDSFKLGIQLFYRDKEGPMFQFNDIISRPGDDPYTMSFWIILSILIFIVLLVVAVIIALVCYMKCRKPNDLQKTINILSRTNKQSIRNKNGIVCCGGKVTNNIKSDGDGEEATVSNNGYTKKMAEKFVRAIVQAIVFGENDTVIRDELADKHLSSNIHRDLSRSPVHANGTRVMRQSSLSSPAESPGPICAHTGAAEELLIDRAQELPGSGHSSLNAHSNQTPV